MHAIFVGVVAASVVFSIIGPEYYDYSHSIASSVCLPCYRKHGSDFDQKAFEKDGVREEYLRALKHVIELNADEDIEFEKVSIKHIE